jgi:hypothetical protein
MFNVNNRQFLDFTPLKKRKEKKKGKERREKTSLQKQVGKPRYHTLWCVSQICT